MIGRLKVSCLLSVAICITCFILLVVFYKKSKEDVTSENYVPIMTEQSEETKENDDN